MLHNRQVIRQVALVALVELIWVALMLGVYALLGRFTSLVLRGALLGGGLAILNFLLLSMAVSRAADQAEQTGEVARATMSIRASAVFRLLGIGVILILVLRAKLCDPLAAVLPLVFLQLSINLVGFLRKDGEKHK